MDSSADYKAIGTTIWGERNEGRCVEDDVDDDGCYYHHDHGHYGDVDDYG